jgi:predicted glycoside hydrolase/deacetylase ChbG (UPF0249 family)
MTPNPLLKKLGYSDTDRLVIIHTDDIGMCQASLQAFQDLWDFGTISSGAVMVPCPWFPATAEFCRHNPEVDMGVHATLNAEWDSYRWGPLSTRDPRSGLLDKAGFFPQDQQAVIAQANLEAVALEINTQVEHALAAGINPTHIDAHMFTAMYPKFIQGYLQAGRAHGIPNMLPRASAQAFDMFGLEDNETRAAYTALSEQLEASSLPMLDGMAWLPLEHADDHIGLAKKMLSEIPAGVTYFLFHPSVDTPELRAIAPDWPARVANYKAFMSPEIKTFLKNSDLQIIGYGKLKNLLKN